MYAAARGHIDIADLLVKSNADVNVKDNVRINTIYIVYIYHRLLALYIHTYRYTNIRLFTYKTHMNIYTYAPIDTSICNICMLIKILISIYNIRYMSFSMKII